MVRSFRSKLRRRSRQRTPSRGLQIEPLESRNLLATIAGIVVYDFLADGVQTDAQRRVETPDFELRDHRVYVDEDGSGTYTNGEPHAYTDDLGKYEIAGLDAGTHAVALEIDTAWQQTFPLAGADHSVTVGAADAVTEIDFGARRPAFVPFTPGNLLVTRASFVLVDLLLEYTPAGELVQAFQIPGSENFSRVLAKDLVLDSQNRVQIFNGYDDVDLMTFDQTLPGFFPTSVPDWDMGPTNTAWGDMAAWGDYIYANEHVHTSGAADGVIRFNVSDLTHDHFSDGFGLPYSLTIGRDGLLYTMESTLSDATIRVHDPETMQPVRSFQVQERLFDVVVDRNGNVFALTDAGLKHYDASGNLIKATIDAGGNADDLYLSGDDTLWMADLHNVETINTDFDPASVHVFDIPGDVGRSVLGFVTVVEPPLAPHPPTDLDLSPAEVLEFQPAGTLVGTLTTTDPDAGDTHVYSLVAGPGDADNASFTIDDDRLKTADVFDRNGQSQHTIRVRTTDPRGLWYEEPLTITVLPSTFVVTHLDPTPTGFTARFNREFRPAEMNLYDVEDSRFGPADATLVGQTTGPVEGSLVLGADWVTFVAQNGPLPADTYSVTLRSADNGFYDPAARDLLDGNRDGTAGDDYLGGFTVDAAPGVIVSLPDFVRGPEQPVVVPADGTHRLPIRVSDAAEITSLQLTLDFDPALLSVTAAEPIAGLPDGTSATLNELGPGQVSISLSSPSPLPAGPADLIAVTAEVPGTATYGAIQRLTFSAVNVNGGSITAAADDAVHVTTFFGDTTGNGSYSGLDAQRIARVGVGLDSGFAALPTIHPFVIGDITDNTEVGGLDAQKVGRQTVGLDAPEIPPLPDPQPNRNDLRVRLAKVPLPSASPDQAVALALDDGLTNDSAAWGSLELALRTPVDQIANTQIASEIDRIDSFTQQPGSDVLLSSTDAPVANDDLPEEARRPIDEFAQTESSADDASGSDGGLNAQIVDEVIARFGAAEI